MQIFEWGICTHETRDERHIKRQKKKIKMIWKMTRVKKYSGKDNSIVMAYDYHK